MAIRMRPCRIHVGWCANAAISNACRLKNLMAQWKNKSPWKSPFLTGFHLFCSQISQIWMGEKWGFFAALAALGLPWLLIYYLMRLILTWGTSCRHDSASPKTGAWPSLVPILDPDPWYQSLTEPSISSTKAFHHSGRCMLLRPPRVDWSGYRGLLSGNQREGGPA